MDSQPVEFRKKNISYLFWFVVAVVLIAGENSMECEKELYNMFSYILLRITENIIEKTEKKTEVWELWTSGEKRGAIISPVSPLFQLWSAASSVLGPSVTCRIFQEYSRNCFINQLLLMCRKFSGIFVQIQLFVMFLFHFFKECSRNILQVRPHP